MMNQRMHRMIRPSLTNTPKGMFSDVVTCILFDLKLLFSDDIFFFFFFFFC